MNQGTILIVDDTLASLKLLADMLTAEGYQVHSAGSEELALASVAASAPELILLDICMPDMDVFEVLRRLKAQEQSHDIPVILLSTASEAEKRVEGFKLGAVDFISKPFQHDELLARVHTHLELFRLRTRLEHQAAELRRAYEQLQIATSTGHNQSDAALRESEARYRAITETATYAIVTADIAGNIAGWNAGAERTFGYTKAEVLGQPLTVLMPQRYHEGHLGGIGRARAGGHVSGRVIELHGLTKTGTEFPLELSLSGWETMEGRFFTGIIRDITERKAMESELQESEARYKRITEGLTDYQYTVRIENGHAVETRQSPACMAVTGYTPEEFAADHYLWISMVAPEDRELVREHVQQILAGKDVPPIEHQIIRKDGETRWVSDTTILFRDASGKLLSYDGVIKDITERKAAEEQIRNLAFYDTLTQLPNRRLLNDRMEQAMAASKRSGRYGALIFLDMDNFKPLNDAHGHDVGDLLLIKVAYRITSCVREMDTVARFGGDEFVVMLSELVVDKAKSITQAGIVAEKIRAALAEPYMLTRKQEGKAEITVEHHCTSSIGVVLFINHEASTEDIIKWADMAMYQAKEAGGNQIRFFAEKS